MLWLSRTGCSARGFSLIEVIIVIGVITVLAGLALPALQRSVYRARMSAADLTLRQDAQLVFVYAHDHGDMFPVADENAFRSMLTWYRPLVSVGLLARDAEADPHGWQVWGDSSYCLTLAAVYGHELMEQGMTVPVAEARSRPVRIDQITFPSQKGLMNQFEVLDAPGGRTLWAGRLPPIGAPVHFADGSSVVAAWSSFNCITTSSGELVTENQVGWPVMTSWRGYLATDR